MIQVRDVLLVAAFATILSGSTGVVFALAKREPSMRPQFGSRGLQRSRALEGNTLFALFEPLIRYGAGRFSSLKLESLRRQLRRALVRSGDYLGLSEDELLALCTLAGLALCATSIAGSAALGLPLWLAPIALLLGAVWPWFRVVAVATERAKSVDRGLPGAVELAAMCMTAGLDFPGALRRIVDAAADQNAPVIEEFGRILQEVELGHTRRSAMESFERRVPTNQVREFVNSVVQAEAKGSPLAPVLTIQAQTQRLRRSVAAEETASEAALMLMGPMTLIFLCVIVLLLGPVVVRFMSGGLGTS